MSIPKHIKEHLALGVTIGSSTRLSVGPGGTFSSIEDALTARAGIAHTLLASITATVTGTTAGTVSVQKAAKVGGDDLTGYVGREVYAQIGGAGPLIKMFIVSATELFSKYPFYADLTAEDFDLYEIKPVSIILQPGHREALTSALSVPSFTSIGTLGLGSASLYTAGAGRLDISDANEVTIYGLQTNQAHNLASGVTLQAQNTDMKTSMCDQITLRSSIFEGGVVDNFLFDELMGTVTIDNCQIDGIWDVFKVGLPVRTVLTNNLLRSVAIDGVTNIATPIDIETSTAVDYPYRSVIINGNNIVAESYSSSPSLCECININSNKSIDLCTISNNVLKSHNHVGNLAVRGISVTAGGNIDVANNLFDLSNAGVATPIDIWGAATTTWNVRMDGTNRKVGDVAFNFIDPLTRISTYTNLA